MNIAYFLRRVLCFCVFLVLAKPGLSLAGDAPLTLDAAIQRTLSNNPELQQFELKAKQLNEGQTIAELRPAINLDMEVENFAGSGELTGFDSAETTLALSSVIEMGGKRESRLQYSTSRIDQFNIERKIETVDLLSSLTQVFISTLSIGERIKLAEQSVKLHTILLETVKNRVDKGISQEADLMRSESSLIEEQIKLERLESEFEINKVSLSSYWGNKSAGFTSVSGDLYQFNLDMSFEELFAQIESSPAVKFYASEARLKQAELQLEKSSNRSDVSWSVGVRQFQETDDTALVAGFSIPLFSGKRNQSKYQRAQYALDAVDFDRRKALLKLHHSLFEAYNVRRQAVSSEEKIRLQVIPALEKAQNITLEGYERGRFSYQEVVIAQRELIAAKLTRVEMATIALLNQSIIEQLIAKPLTKEYSAAKIPD